MQRTKNTSRGFTLVELMVSLVIGAITLATSVQLYSQAVKATIVTSQRAEM